MEKDDPAEKNKPWTNGENLMNIKKSGKFMFYRKLLYFIIIIFFV